MRTERYLLFLLILLVLIAAVNFFAIKVHLYWDVYWFDRVMHFFGGLWAGSFGLWFFFLRLHAKTSRGIASIFLTSFLSALLIGVLWELFELFTHLYSIFGTEKAFMFDTLSDLFFDIVGSFFASFLFLALKKKPALKQ